MRVLVPLHGFVMWNGGLDLVRLIVSALSHPDVSERIELHFALPQDSPVKRVVLSTLRRWRSFHARSPQGVSDAGSAAALLIAAGDITAGHNVVSCPNTGAGILKAATEVDADIIFPTMLSLGRSPRPRIGYLYDFQHRYLPVLFSARMRRNRDRNFAAVAADADGLVVNSKSVASDVVQLLGIPSRRVLAMPFAPYVRPWWFDADPAETQRRHSIHGPYLLVCNHFWKHKDHATALRAFALLREDPRNTDLRLVLTGDPIDHRDPQHYHRLVALSDSLGITQHTYFLGLIPKPDQIALLRGCKVFWQPTLFEGGPGGGSTYEAIGLGMPVVISDIAINREIDRGHVTFFQAGNPHDLAEKTASVMSSGATHPTHEELLANSNASLSRLATSIACFLEEFTGTRNE